MRRFITIVMFVLAVTLTVTLSANDKARELKLQQAIDLLESKGDVAKATPLLEDVAKSTDRALAARGLLHLAQAQERYGKGDSTATYQRIIAGFGGPAETGAVAAVATEARAKLGTTAMNQRGGGVLLRQVWEQRGTFPPWAPNTQHVSLHGRHLYFTDWKSGDLAARDLASGRDRLLTTDANWPRSNYAEIALPSPDSKLVAYSWRWVAGKQPTELRVIDREGGRARVVYRNDLGDDNVFPVGWMPDNKTLLASVISNNRVRLLLMPAAGGAPRLVKSFDGPGQHPQSFRLSPDGRFVAYTSRTRPRGQVWDVTLLSVETGAESAAINHPADDRILDWSPDGSRILFTSDRGGTHGIWSTRVADGRAKGDAILIHANTGLVERAGFTKQGQFYYRALRIETDVVLATIDPASGKLTGQLTPLEGRFAGGKDEAAWSPTGDRIAYVQATAARAVRAGRSADMNTQLAIQSTATGQVRLWPFALETIDTPVWLHSGQALLIRGTDLTGIWSWYSVNIDTGALTRTDLLGGSPLNGAPAISQDDRRLMQVGTDGRRGGIIAQDVSSGDFELMFADAGSGVAPRIQSVALSPDGRRLAATRRTVGELPALFVIPAAGGDVWPLMPSDNARPLDGQALAWSHDGRHLFVVRTPAASGRLVSEIWQIPVDGGEPRDTGIQWAGRITRISSHPDGGTVAVSTFQATETTWVLQNIPPQR